MMGHIADYHPERIKREGLTPDQQARLLEIDEIIDDATPTTVEDREKTPCV